VRSLLLVRHAPTSATRAAAFPVDEPVDERGRAAAARLADLVPRDFEVLSSPLLRCLQTAAAAGLTPRVEGRVAECDFGRWAGATLHEIGSDGARAWMTDPDASPHGGESLRAFAARIAAWLQSESRSAMVITHGGVVRAAVVHALGAPLEAFWRIDVAPLSVTELHCHDGRWKLTRLNEQVAA
jgi:broad specificity phosphatase PhoE